LNVTQNNPHVSGEFTGELQPLLEELAEMPEFAELRLDGLVIDTTPPIPGEQKEPDRPVGVRVEIQCTDDAYETIRDTIEEWSSTPGLTIDIS